MLRSPLQKLSLNLTRGRLCTLPALCAAQRFGCKMENGQRIYTSDFPSILSRVDQEKSLFEFLQKRLKAADQKKKALIQAETEESITYGELGNVVERIAAVMYHKAGIRKGDTVTVALTNTIYFGPIVYAILRLGARVSTVNAASDAETLAYYAKAAKSKLILATKYHQKEAEGAARRIIHENKGPIEILYPEEFVRESSPAPIDDYNGVSDAKPDDTIFIPFSSGTTGLPKGVQLTNRNLVANTIQAAELTQLDDNDCTISVLPYFHIFGFTANLCAFAAIGGTQVVMSKYMIDLYTDCIEKYKVTFAWVAPPIVISLLKNADSYKHKDISSLQSIRCGAAPIGADVQRAAEAVLSNCTVCQGYGMTEMGPLTNVNPKRSPRGSHGHAGPLPPDTEMRIVKVDDSQQSGADKSAGIDAEEGEEGEIWFRGPQQMKGYLNKEDTDKCMHEGWYRTGDIGRVNPETGFLSITDRLKELIKYKGFQVSPAQLEGVLLDHPWVNDCIVVGITDPKDISFEVPRTLVVLKPDLPKEDVAHAVDNIIEYMTKRMPPHQRLHGGVRVVDEIPKNASGKLLRRVARQQETEYIKKNVGSLRAKH